LVAVWGVFYVFGRADNGKVLVLAVLCCDWTRRKMGESPSSMISTVG